MDLKDTISKWHTAMCLLDEDRVNESVDILRRIKTPSAKILHNIGCLRMSQLMYQEAVQFFTDALEKDNYLVLSYFQRGICYYEMHRYERAEEDFLKAHSMTPEDGINYTKLGADFILQPKSLANYAKVTREVQYGKRTIDIPKIFSLDCVFWPPKKMVENLSKKDFLGKAKVVSSTDESDIEYAAEKVVASFQKKDGGSSTKPIPVPAARVVKRKDGTEVTLPAPPRRPPPCLPSSLTSSPQGRPAGQGPSLGRAKSRSVEDMLDVCRETPSFKPLGSVNSVSNIHDNSNNNQRGRVSNSAVIQETGASSKPPKPLYSLAKTFGARPAQGNDASCHPNNKHKFIPANHIPASPLQGKRGLPPPRPLWPPTVPRSRTPDPASPQKSSTSDNDPPKKSVKELASKFS